MHSLIAACLESALVLLVRCVGFMARALTPATYVTSQTCGSTIPTFAGIECGGAALLQAMAD